MGLKRDREARSVSPSDPGAEPAAKPAPERAPGPTSDRPRGPSRDTSLAVSTLVGVAASVVLAVASNAIAARHFHRWDATLGGLYTLTDATKETLRGLEEPLVIHVLLPEGDPLRESLDQLLLQYRSESTRLDVRTTDPDRAPAELLAVQQKYGIVAGRTEDGRVVTDAAVVIARADEPFFLTAEDFVEVDDASDLRTRPRLEEALTGGIRRVLAGDRPRVCFTEGHGERSVDVAGENGLAVLRDRLVKNNYEVTAVWADGSEPAAPLTGCDLVLVAGPTLPMPPRHVDALRSFVEGGGNALLVVGPVPREDDRGYVDINDASLLALAGVRREADFVFELDPDRRATRGFGETFLPEVKEHPATTGARGGRAEGDVVITVASSLSDVGGNLAPQRLLTTSPQAFGMVDFFAWAKEPGEPAKKDEDRAGPLAVAVAIERPKSGDRERGARMVVVSSSSVLAEPNWREPDLRATALFVEGCITWLSSHRAFLDLPPKPVGSLSGLELTEGGVATLTRSTVILLPAASALGGLLVWLARRREAPPKRPKRPAKDAT